MQKKMFYFFCSLLNGFNYKIELITSYHTIWTIKICCFQKLKKIKNMSEINDYVLINIII